MPYPISSLAPQDFPWRLGLLHVRIVRDVLGQVQQKVDLETKLSYRRLIGESSQKQSLWRCEESRMTQKEKQSCVAVTTTASGGHLGISRTQRTWDLTWIRQFCTLTSARYGVWVAPREGLNLRQGEAPSPIWPCWELSVVKNSGS